MIDRKWPWTIWVFVGLVFAAVIVGGWRLRSTGRPVGPEPVAAPPRSAPPAVVLPSADPADLQSLERRLLAAGELEDSERRDMITEEVTEALIMFHGKPDDPPVVSVTVPDAAVDADSAKDYDVVALRAEFDEARAEKNSHLRRLGLGAVAEFLAANDPELAEEWVEELLTPGVTDPSPDAYVFTSIFAEAFARTSLDDAVMWTAGLSNDTLRKVAHQYIAREWAPRDIAAVEVWIASNGDAGERSNIIRSVDGALRTGDDDAPSAWAQRLAANPADGPRHSDVVVRYWARTDLEAAINWASSLPDPDDVGRSVDGLAEAFAAKNPRAATQWTASFPDGPVRFRALTQTAVYWAHFEPLEAARWIEDLGEPGVLESTVPGVYYSLLAKDPAGAESWIEGLPIRGEFRDYVRSLNSTATD